MHQSSIGLNYSRVVWNIQQMPKMPIKDFDFHFRTKKVFRTANHTSFFSLLRATVGLFCSEFFYSIERFMSDCKRNSFKKLFLKCIWKYIHKSSGKGQYSLRMTIFFLYLSPYFDDADSFLFWHLYLTHRYKAGKKFDFALSVTKHCIYILLCKRTLTISIVWKPSEMGCYQEHLVLMFFIDNFDYILSALFTQAKEKINFPWICMFFILFCYISHYHFSVWKNLY